MSKIELRLQQATILLLYSICAVAALFFKGKHWVICERGTDARDNAYWLYKYIKENHPTQKLWYIIDRSSADYKKVQEDAVQPGSFRNYWVLATAEKLISTHYAAGLPMRNSKLFRLCGLHKKFYFLQHGVINNDVPGLYAVNAPMQLFICGAEPEYTHIVKHFGHPEKTVKYTGLARFDQLHHSTTKRQILLMPTWRSYIKTKEDFLQSRFYSCWQSLLSSQALASMLHEHDVQMVVYLHFEMQKFTDCFQTSTDHIVLAKFEDHDVQQLLKESAVLITDYSSVFFDFAYMKKPVLHYCFDQEDFFREHYQKGYFDIQQMGFGDVCLLESEVLESLRRICDNRMQAEQKYIDRIDRFFPLHDTNNCQRIYDLISGDRHEE